MANITEFPVWHEKIYLIDTDDPVEGGVDGVDNKPHKQLADRTAYNKQMIERLEVTRSYDSVEAMKADDKLKINQIVKTRGYYTAGDGGGNTYLVCANTQLNDASKHIDISNNLEARAFEIQNILQCGAKPNTDISHILSTADDYIKIPPGEFFIDSNAGGRYVSIGDNTILTGVGTHTIHTDDVYTNRVPTRYTKNVLFIGDSLTEKRNGSSYSWYVANALASKQNGYKQIGYIPFSSYRTKYDIGNINVNSNGMTEMYGASDQKFGEFPFNYSPDGKGLYISSATGTENITIRLNDELSYDFLRLYFLETQNGGKCSVRAQKTQFIDAVTVDCNTTTQEKLKYVDIAFDPAEDFDIIIDNFEQGRDYYLFGIELLTQQTNSGFTYNIFARNGAKAYDFAQLHDATKLYYEKINPSLVLINLGTNDAYSSRTVAQYKKDLHTICTRITESAQAAQIVIVEPTQTKDSATDRFRQFTIARREVAQEAGYYYIDVPRSAGKYIDFKNQRMMNSDGVHPNTVGKKIIASVIVDKLQTNITPSNHYYPTTKTYTTHHTLKTYQAIKTQPDGERVTIRSFGLVGQNISAYFDLRLVVSMFGILIVKRIKFYAIKKSSMPKGKVSEIRNVEITDEYSSMSRLAKLEVNVDVIDNIASISFMPIDFNATSYTLNGNYTTNAYIPEGSALVEYNNEV